MKNQVKAQIAALRMLLNKSKAEQIPGQTQGWSDMGRRNQLMEPKIAINDDAEILKWLGLDE